MNSVPRRRRPRRRVGPSAHVAGTEKISPRPLAEGPGVRAPVSPRPPRERCLAIQFFHARSRAFPRAAGIRPGVHAGLTFAGGNTPTAPKGQRFTQPRATPWGNFTLRAALVGPTGQPFLDQVGPLMRQLDINLTRVPQGVALGWANAWAFGPRCGHREISPRPLGEGPGLRAPVSGLARRGRDASRFNSSTPVHGRFRRSRYSAGVDAGLERRRDDRIVRLVYEPPPAMLPSRTPVNGRDRIPTEQERGGWVSKTRGNVLR